MCQADPLDTPSGILGKIGTNSCFQVNYDLPNIPKSFYSPIYWAVSKTFSSTSFEWLSKIFHDSQVAMNLNQDADAIKNTSHVKKRDLSAGEFYDTLEEILEE